MNQTVDVEDRYLAVSSLDYGINPIASYITLAIVLVFLTGLFLSRLIITIEKPKNDLVIFNSQRNRNLKPLISKHTSSQAALNNTRLAISLGLMQAPVAGVDSQPGASSSLAAKWTGDADDDAFETKPTPSRFKNSKF